MRLVIVLTGRIRNGKSKLASMLADQLGFHVVDSSELVAARLAGDASRGALQAAGDRLDGETSDRWLYDAVRSVDAELPQNKTIVVDHVRTLAQLRHFRQDHGWQTVHVHLYAPTAMLAERFRKSPGHRGNADDEFQIADSIKSEDDIEGFKSDADVRVFTARSDVTDTFVRVVAHLGLFPPPDLRCVDVLVGGQFGSEGKGHVAAYLARQYDVLMRVGGPNAGHTVSSETGVYTYHQLPSGCRDTKALVLLGAGATLYVPDLLKEIEDCGLTPDRLAIDPQAMIIEGRDKEIEGGLVTGIGSTGSGSGAASARKIMGRHDPSTRLARDVNELKPFLCSTIELLEESYKRGRFVLLEGTQGSGLSIHHGVYPYVTSRDTNVAGCLAEAGISPTRVRKVLMVVRPTPIRVESPRDGTSGPLKHETNFAEVARLAKLDPDDLVANEKTSTTQRKRRVGWFDWELYRKSCAINAPTDIVLTFADYLNAKNSEARRFEQLDSDTIKFIEELERVAQAPVSLINTRFPRSDKERLDLRSVIDRRTWWTPPRRLGRHDREPEPVRR